MDRYTFEETISSSKEESIAKAIRLIQEDCSTKGHLHRPDISTKKVLTRFVLWLFIIGLLVFLCIQLGRFLYIPTYISYSVVAIGCLLIIILKAKSIVQNMILLYQKHAPEKIRRSCLFTPSCSDYMLLAVQKYGVMIGVYKGICRLGRCHYPNGGEDYP